MEYSNFTHMVENSSLSNILVTHMTNPFSDYQISQARDVISRKTGKGEEHLRSLFYQFCGQFWRGKQQQKDITTHAFPDEHSYLVFLQKQTPPSYRRQLSNIEKKFGKGNSDQQYLSGRLRRYQAINQRAKPQDRDDKLIKDLKQTPLYLEMAHLKGSQKDGGHKLWAMIVRRKDTERAIQKIATRTLEKEITDANGGDYTKRVAIDDWFGIKLVALTEAYAKRGLFNQVYGNLPSYGLELESTDDHYLPGFKDNLKQLKVMAAGDQGHHLREIIITDLLNARIAEMEHSMYQLDQQSKLRKIRRNRKHRKRYDFLVDRGRELVGTLPKKRKRILVPGEDFSAMP
jgi:hypothetical protein